MGYLRYRKYPIPKNRKTKKPTANEEALQKILRKNPGDLVLPSVLEARALQKADGYLADTYVGQDGRFHPEWSRHPETLRFSSRRPNAQNLPKGRTPGIDELIAEAVLSTIIAKPGYVLIERDFKAQEPLLTGYFAGDENYMRMSRLGIYSYFLSHKVGKKVNLEQPDDVVRKELDQIKSCYPFEYKVFKKVVLSRSYGEHIYNIAKDLEPYFMAEARVEALKVAKEKKWFKEIQGDPLLDSRVSHLVFDFVDILSKQASREYIRIYEEAAPKVVEWQTKIRLQAHKERKLSNPFGYVRHFWEVFKKDGDKWVLGSEANQVLAYLPQSSGAGIITKKTLELSRMNLPDFNIIILEHDKIVSEVPEHLGDNYLEVMRTVMEGPIKELGGLCIETEGKMGRNWMDMRPEED